AFTGATKAKEAIIDEADGSILFLDEVHRLPPEGQEMIFYFMYHGVYARLGETVKSHDADVRIMCATTEKPNYSLLNT
ncbi:sigma 54-interacting transcriptional regulator, partial [Enterococcus faecalis]|uniref:sigma 54-interacting transcriptional regulator n=1 Tax=Enterococcus faecalis TaxID=1351 RepID=UPI003D6B4792